MGEKNCSKRGHPDYLRKAKTSGGVLRGKKERDRTWERGTRGERSHERKSAIMAMVVSSNDR